MKGLSCCQAGAVLWTSTARAAEECEGRDRLCDILWSANALSPALPQLVTHTGCSCAEVHLVCPVPSKTGITLSCRSMQSKSLLIGQHTIGGSFQLAMAMLGVSIFKPLQTAETCVTSNSTRGRERRVGCSHLRKVVLLQGPARLGVHRVCPDQLAQQLAQ